MVYTCDMCGNAVMHVSLYGENYLCAECIKKAKSDNKIDIKRVNAKIEELSKQITSAILTIDKLEEKITLSINEINKIKSDVRRLKTK